jgi:hypothetical protein
VAQHARFAAGINRGPIFSRFFAKSRESFLMRVADDADFPGGVTLIMVHHSPAFRMAGSRKK